jgi:exosortase/archaeosortase family protein
MSRPAAPEDARARAVTLRFVAGFVVAALAFELAFVTCVDGSRWFGAYLAATARAAAALLGAAGLEALASGQVVALGPYGHVELLRGCDGLESVGLFVLAVVLFPAPLGARIRFAALGSVLIVALNLVRVVSLCLAVVFRPGWFEGLHVVVWPVIFVLGPLALWSAWTARLR